MKTVRCYSMPSEASVDQAVLESAGIPTLIRNDLTVQTNWLCSNAIGGVELEVPDENFSEACELLKIPEGQVGILSCPSCGSSRIKIRPMSAFTAICMALKFPIPERVSTFDCQACHTTHTCRRAG